MFIKVHVKEYNTVVLNPTEYGILYFPLSSVRNPRIEKCFNGAVSIYLICLIFIIFLSSSLIYFKVYLINTYTLYVNGYFNLFYDSGHPSIMGRILLKHVICITHLIYIIVFIKRSTLQYYWP